MKRPKRTDFIRDKMYLTDSYSTEQDKYIDYLEKHTLILENNNESLLNLVQELNTHIKLQNA